jgi:CRISPR-associated protein Cas1
MPTACILQPEASIHLVSERLEVHGLDEQENQALLRVIPIRDLDRLILSEKVQVSSGAMAALLRADISVSFLGWNGDFLGSFQPCTPSHGLARLNQYKQFGDPAFVLPMAGRIVAAKVYNQRRVLQRLSASRAEDEAGSLAAAESIRSTLAWMDNLMASVAGCGSVDELRGYEGASTAKYFQAWAQFLPPDFPFERRSTRPPLNPVNACISFGATMIYHEMHSFLHAHGLEPALGLLHSADNQRWSLALDLLEPFRPVLVEALALDLFSREMLNKQHFEPANQGVYLNDAGRRKFILQYERRMEREFMSECAGHRTCLRQQLENQAVMIKSALANPESFQPFLMN